MTRGAPATVARSPAELGFPDGSIWDRLSALNSINPFHPTDSCGRPICLKKLEVKWLPKLHDIGYLQCSSIQGAGFEKWFARFPL